jgi:hypothetical protein
MMNGNSKMQYLPLYWFVIILATVGVTFVCGLLLTNDRMVYGTRTILPLIASALILIFFLISRGLLKDNFRALFFGLLFGLLSGAIAIALNFIVGDYFLGRPVRDLLSLMNDPLDNIFGSILTLTPIAGAVSFIVGKQVEKKLL